MKIEVQIAASLMCCNSLIMGEEVLALQNAGCDGFHVDIMDGTFVQNFAMNIRDIQFIRQITPFSIDAHLMILHPSRYLNAIVNSGASRVILHPESCLNYIDDLQSICSLGAKAGIALSPTDPLCSLNERSVQFIDTVLVMAVNPGFAGQPYLPGTEDRVDQIQQRLNNLGASHVLIEVDGAVSTQTLPLLFERGARKFVAGTSGLFLEGTSYAQNVQQLKTSITCLMVS